MRLGIFGGTFNPIHFGHLRAAEEAKEKLALDRILFMPSGNPPLKSEELADARTRYRLVELAIADNPGFEALDIECAAPGKSYTVNTLEKLRERYPSSELVFILGIDAFLDLPHWREPERLLSMSNFAIISRPGAMFKDLLRSPYLEVPEKTLSSLDSGGAELFSTVLKGGMTLHLVRLALMEISSTVIRKRLKQGLSIKYLLPEKLELFIISQRLYNK